MQTSKKGLDLIKAEEGFVSKAYNDVAGFKTIGYGHKIAPTDTFPVYGISEAQAEIVLQNDVAHVEWFLNKFLEEMHAIVNQNQFDALVDFGFNLGVGSLHQMLSHGVLQVPTQIVRWTHASGKVMQDLVNRRKKELELWQSPTSVEDATAKE